MKRRQKCIVRNNIILKKAVIPENAKHLSGIQGTL